ncbi:hypothetical protein FRZ44_21890 [Hypericibacter terrae]|uniref:Uncharacterized protein n=1 Tax=Hypericibacter terrae TaxID=2602015 RepID=A0A5J6MHG0_9PROT|nr:hypothetical protein FRZ44_21890 [Hypericibacter terrae]
MELPEGIVDAGQNPGAGFGQDQPLLGPLEQRNPQGIFEKPDLLADSRGRDMELPRGLNQAAVAGCRPKGPEGVERGKASGTSSHREPPAIRKNLLIADQFSSD